MNKFIGQNEDYGVFVHWNEPYRESPHIVFLSRSVNPKYGEYEAIIEARHFDSIDDAIEVANQYLSMN